MFRIFTNSRVILPSRKADEISQLFLLYIFAMKNTLTNNSVVASYFVVESNNAGVTEITSIPGGEDWNYVHLEVVPTGEVKVFIYLPLLNGMPLHQIRTRRQWSRAFCETIGLANAIESICRAELPHQIKNAISHDDIKDEYFFWKNPATGKRRRFRHISVKEQIRKELSRLQL